MATQEALGHHHPIVVVAVEVSSVGGSAGIGQERTMPDGSWLPAGGRWRGALGEGLLTLLTELAGGAGMPAELEGWGCV